MLLLGLLSACAKTTVNPIYGQAANGSGLVLAKLPDDTMLLDASSGELRGAIASRAVGRAPQLANGILYSIDRGLVRAQQLHSGRMALPFSDGQSWLHSALLVTEQQLYALALAAYGHAPERLVAIDRHSGKLLWDKPLPLRRARLHPSLQPVLGPGYVVVPVGRQVLAFDGASGKTLWGYQAKATLRWPTVGNGAIFVSSDDGTVHAIDAATGDARYIHSITTNRRIAPLYSHQQQVVVAANDWLVAYDSSSGAELWQRRNVEPVALGGVMLVCPKPCGRDLVALDPAGGQPRWRLHLRELRAAPLFAPREALVIVQDGDILRAIDQATGAERWRKNLSE